MQKSTSNQRMHSALGARYGFKEPRSRAIQRPDDGLYKFFREWLDKYDGDDGFGHYMYELQPLLSAMGKCGFLNLPKKQEDIDYLALSFRDHENIQLAGEFLSTLYNLSGLKKIVLDFDEDLLIDDLGKGFSGLLINMGYSGWNLGASASGITVNFGKTNHASAQNHTGLAINNGEDTGCFGIEAPGVVINNGKAGSISGNGIIVVNGEVESISDKIKGNVICIKEPKKYSWCPQGKVLKPEDCSPELIRYVQEIESLSRRLVDSDETETQMILNQLDPKKVEEELYRLSEL